MPYIDHFMPVHNLASPEQLGQLLASLNQKVPGTTVAN